MTTQTLNRALLSPTHKAAFDLRGAEADTVGTAAVLLVSVGAAYHEGEKLAATVDLINRSGFAHVTVAVADTLQRHNVDAPTYVEKRAHSRETGREWVNRNAFVLDSINADTAIVHWDEVISDPAYLEWFDRVRDAFNLDADYRASIEATINVFLDRQPDLDAEERDRYKRASLTYLIEECPAIMPLWADQGFDFVIYPQRISQAMDHTGRLFVAARGLDKVRWLPLRFKKRKSALNSVTAVDSR